MVLSKALFAVSTLQASFTQGGPANHMIPTGRTHGYRPAGIIG